MQKYLMYVLAIATITIAWTLIDVSPSIAQAESVKDHEDKIKKIEQEKGELEDKQSKVKQDKASVESKMDENLDSQASLEAQMEAIESELTATEAEIAEVEQNIAQTDEELARLAEEIKELKAEIKQLEKQIKEREKVLKDRLRSIQENGGNVPYMSVILGAASFSELISRSSAVNSIMNQDKSIMEEHFADKRKLQQKQESVKEKKATVEEKKAEQEAHKKDLNNLHTQLDGQKAKKEKIKEKLVEEYGELEEYSLSLAEENEIMANHASALEQAKALAQNEIARIEEEERQAELEAQQQAEKESQSESVGEEDTSNNSSSTGSTGGSSTPAPNKPSQPNVSTGGGGFGWPASGAFTSGFGPRWGTNHNGIDISAPRGTAVTASAAGVVSSVNTGCVEGNKQCGGGYGNFIIVTHFINGQAFDTLYGHLSSVSVSNGQTVGKGQHIGGIGHTGDSTGPHLHFEIHPGGYRNPVDPMGYLN